MAISDGARVSDADSKSAKVAMINDPHVRGLVFQVVTVALVLWIGWYFSSNATENMRAQGIATGFGFLEQPAGFDISQTLISYPPNATYGRVLLVGLLNTILVAVIGIFFATILGFLVGVARLSTNWVVRNLARAYVEVTRNLPLLFQILFWYIVLTRVAPSARDAIAPLDGVFISNRGLTLPRPVWGDNSEFALYALLAAIVVAFIIRKWSAKRQAETGQQFPVFLTSLAAIVGLPLIALMLVGFPLTWDVGTQTRFNIAGGFTVTPEFLALLIALSVYTAGFIAEIVRAGIMAVSHGQTEAAHSLGLRNGPTLRLVVIPQAMRVIIPPLTSQYLNLTKNSSLGVAIAYPELFAVFGGTTLNQTGQAIQVIAITMACYLTMSIITSIFMNWYNQRIALVER